MTTELLETKPRSRTTALRPTEASKAAVCYVRSISIPAVRRGTQVEFHSGRRTESIDRGSLTALIDDGPGSEREATIAAN